MVQLNPNDADFDASKVESRLFIGGQWIESEKTFDVHSPMTNKPFIKVHEASAAHVDQAVREAEAALPAWQAVPGYEKSALIQKWAELYVRDWEELAQLDAACMAQPVSTFAALQLPYAAGIMNYYAGAIPHVQGETSLHTPGSINITLREPYGVVAGIIPWNVPVIMLVLKACPAIGAGNCIIIKSSEKAPLSALKMAALAKEAGIPDGVVQVVSGFGQPTGQALAEHPRIRKIAFTGSTRTGKLVQQMATSSNLKACTLELGGKSPLIVFADANMELTIPKAVNSITINSGQVCMASSRVYVERSAAKAFIEEYRKQLAAIQHSDPFQPSKVRGGAIGPQADKIQFDNVLRLIEQGKKEGKLLIGGENGSSNATGAGFIHPTIFLDVPETAEIAKREIFGPVVIVNTFETEEEVLARANDTEHGLYASVFTTDLNRALRVGRALEAGCVAINEASPTVAYDLPSGGYKQSGNGREMGRDGIYAWTELKTLIIKVEGLNAVAA